MYTFSLKWRHLLIVFLAIAVVSAFFSYQLFESQKHQYIDEIDAKLLLVAQMARHLAGEDFHDRITGSESLSPSDYLSLGKKYTDILNNAHLGRLWSNLILPDGHIVLTSASLPNKGEQSGFFDTDANLQSFRPLPGNGQAVYSNFSNQWSSGRMLLLSFQDKLGRSYFFGASTAKGEIEQRLNELRWTAFSVFFSMLSVATLASLFLARLVMRPSIPIAGKASNSSIHVSERLLEQVSLQPESAVSNSSSSEQGLLKSLIKTLPDLIWLKDPDGVYLACNPEFEKLYGASEAQIVGKTDYDFVDRELADFFRENDQAAIVNGGPTVNEEWLVYADNSHQGLMETTKTPMYSEEGELIGVLGFAYDITAFREQEKALRRESEKNLAILHNASDGIHIVDETGAIVEASDSFCDMLGYTREEVIGMKIKDWDANFAPDEITEILKRQHANPERVLFETRYRRKDGSLLDVEITCLSLKIDDQSLLFCSSRDITLRKQIEARLIRSESTLQRAQEVAHIGSWVFDFSNGKLEWSLEIYRIFGIDPDTKIEFEQFLACLHPDDIEFVQTAWQSALAGADYDIEHRILVAGEIRWVHELAKIDFAADGAPLIGLGTVQDVTHTHMLVETLRINQERLAFALQGSNDGLWDWNLDTNEVYFSPRWLDMLGYAPGELPNKLETWELLVHPDDKATALAAVADYLEGRTLRYEIEFRMQHKQGNWLYILSRARFANHLSPRSMNSHRLVGTHVDLTERKRIEQALAQQLEFSDALINAQTDGIAVFYSTEEYPYYIFTVWNQAMQEITGYSIEEINRQGWYQTVYVDLEERELARLRMARMAQGEHLNREEWTISRKDGEQRTVQFTTTIFSSQDGKSHVLAVTRDVTEQNLAQAQLRESEGRMRMLFESSADPILLIEKDCFMDCNLAAVTMLGLSSREQIRQVSLSDISPEFQPDGQRSDQKAREMIQQALNLGSYLFEWEHRGINGQRIMVEVMLTVIMHNNNRLLHVVWRDLSRLHAAQLELQRRERYQRAVLDNFPFMVWLKDEESRYLAVNQPFVNACGLGSSADLVGKTDFDVWPQAMAEHYRADDFEVLSSNHSKTLEEQVIGLEHAGWVETYKSPITLDGKVIGTVGFARDINERKLAEQAIQRYALIYDLLYQISSSFINLSEDCIDSGIEKALGEIAKFVGIDRACLFSYDDAANNVSKSHEWCAQGVNPQINLFQNICLSDLSAWMITRAAEGMTIIPDVSVMPSCAMRGTLEQFGVKSLLLIPLTSKQYCLGWVGFSNLTQVHDFSSEDIKLLSLFATLLVNLHERQGFEKVLRKNQQLLAETQRVGRIGGWRASPERNFLEWSEGVYSLVEMPMDFHPDFETGLDFYAPDSRQKVVENLNCSLETGLPFSIETEIHTYTGKDIWVELRGAPQYNNERLEYLTGTIQDITQRKQAEKALEEYRLHLEDIVQARTAELEAVNRRLSMSDQRLSAMFAMSQRVNELNEDQLLQLGIEEAVRLTDSEIGYLHLVNVDQETMTLFTGSPKPLDYYSAAYNNHYPDSQAGIWADMVCFKKPVIHNNYQQMLDFQDNPEGHAHLIRHLGVPVMEDGKVMLLLGVGNKTSDYDDSDVNQLQLIGNDLWAIVLRRRMTQALSEAREASEAASRAKSAFLANMSHELRTPMNGIIGMTSLALRRAEEPKLRDQLEKVEQASQHLLAIINDILDISQIEAERMSLEQIDFKLNEVLENITNLIAPKSEAAGLNFQIELTPEIERLSLQGDPLRLGQILLNLTGNAVKFTEAGKITLRIRVDEDNPKNVLLRFEVQDTGIGVAAENVQRLFNAFEQADSSMTRKYGGTGLGLAISKRLVNMMGGEIGLTSQEGEGSNFWFTARLAKSAEALMSPVDLQQNTPDAQLKARFSGARILLVEDEPINQEVSRWMLEEVGLQVDLAEDGLQAVEMVKMNHYALILMDMQMPIMNGVDATREIRKLPGYAETPILAMTANAFAEDRQVCLEVGMNDHIGKPVNPDVLYETLLCWLSIMET